MIDVIEYTDPCCSWAWGSEPKLRRLRWVFGDQVSWRTVLGGLVDDASEVYRDMDDAQAGQRLARYWSRVTAHTSAPYPVHLRWPPLTSHRMGQAVKAASFQGVTAGEAMLRALREAIFVVGRPADTWERILDVAMTLPELDSVAFARDLQSPQAESAYELDWAETRAPNRFVRELQGDWPGIGNVKQDGAHQRYAFPTLLIRVGDDEQTLPGWIAYDDYVEAFSAAGVDIAAGRELPSADEALQVYGMLTRNDLAVVTSDEQWPSSAVIHDWGEGEVALSSAVARRWAEAGWR